VTSGKQGLLRTLIDECRRASRRRKPCAGFFTLVEDNGWSYARAEEWLLQAARQALF
jgi:DNA-directed RNA polymerase specialized sigma24 family protein